MVSQYITRDNGICRSPGSMDPGAQPSVIATLDLETVDYYNRLLLFNILNTALNTGKLDTMRVSPRGFSFRPITGSHCVLSVVDVVVIFR